MISKSIRTIVFATTLIITSCNTDIPDLEKKVAGEPMSGKVSVEYIKSLYKGYPMTIQEEVHIEGYIISTDLYGNFYKTLVIEDETGGISIKVDMENIYRKFGYLDKVSLNCNSLTIGSYGGLIQLGTKSGDNSYQTDYISQTFLQSILNRKEEYPDNVYPAFITIPEAGEKYINRFVAFENVQFIDEEIGLCFTEYKEYTDRHIIDRKGNVLPVRTSPSATFANHNLPNGSGLIKGILSWFNGECQLILPTDYSCVMTGERF